MREFKMTTLALILIFGVVFRSQSLSAQSMAAALLTQTPGGTLDGKST